MAFRDYSNTPSANTMVGNSTFIGPNMPRDNVRPALQQLAADGRGLYDFVNTTVSGAVSGASNFRATLAEGVSSFAVGQYFSTAETGELRVYKRIAAPPYYEDMGDEAAPVTRSMVVGPDGASNIGYSRSGIATLQRSVKARLDDTHNVRDFGAIGDGQYRTLANVYNSLAAAQVVYPFATSLSQSLDWAGIQLCINAAAITRARVLIPMGTFILSDSLQVPSYSWIEGESREGSVIYNQTIPLNVPVFVNADPTAFLYATIRNMTALGGTMFLKVSASIETAGCSVSEITANLQSQKSMEWSSCQTTTFRNCLFLGGRDYGVDFLGFPCNAVTFDHVRIGDVRRYPLRVRGYDLLTICNSSSIEGGALQPNNVTASCAGTTLTVSAITGPNIELGQLVVGDGIAPGTRIVANAITNPGAYSGGGGGGTYGVNTSQTFSARSAVISFAAIDAEAGPSGTANMLVIRDSYLEGVHKILLHNLTASGSPSGTMLDGNKITNAIDGLGVLFSGNATITFGTNFWGQPTPGPVSATIIGQNKGMELDRHWTPTVSSLTGALTAVTVNDATYRDVPGGLRRITVDVTITTNGTGAGAIRITLPSVPAWNDLVPGREIATSGFGLSAQLTAGSNVMTVTKSSDGSYPGGTGNRLLLSGFYRTQ